MLILDFIDFLDIIGVIVFAISGALKGLKYNLDILGVVVLGFITALGGGVIRDLIMNTVPYIFLNERDIYIAILASLFTFYFGRKIHNYVNIIKIFDAAGLAVFTVIGAEKALSGGFFVMGIITMATLTGVAGGIIRDILVNEIPFVLKEEVYALFCIIGSFLYWLLISILKFNKSITILIIILLIFTGRILAIFWNLQLPKSKI